MATYLKRYRIRHIRSAPTTPMTQSKIEHYHRTMKNIVKLENFYYPWMLEEAIAGFVDYYTHQRYHESLDNLTPAVVHHGRAEEVQRRGEETKRRTLRERCRHNLQLGCMFKIRARAEWRPG